MDPNQNTCECKFKKFKSKNAQTTVILARDQETANNATQEASYTPLYAAQHVLWDTTEPTTTCVRSALTDVVIAQPLAAHLAKEDISYKEALAWPLAIKVTSEIKFPEPATPA